MSKCLKLMGPLIFLLFAEAGFSVTCPDPEKVSGSVTRFSLSDKETSSFVDKSQIDDSRPDQRLQIGIKYQVRPDCYSSDYNTQKGCPKNSLAQMTFVKAVLNKFRSGDQGTVWCYYQTPEGTMTAVNIDFGKGGTYRVANPVGGAWNSLSRFMSVCKAYNVNSCPFDFERGEVPDALDAR